MQGRLEHQLKIEKRIGYLLENCPGIINEYYHYLAASMEPTTCIEYIKTLKRFNEYVGKNILEVNSVDINKYLHQASIKQTKNGITETSFSYRSRIYSVLCSFFKYLKTSGKIDDNPMIDVERVKNIDYINRKELTQHDLTQMIDAVNYGAGTYEQVLRQKEWKLRDKAILTLFIVTGIRVTALTEINISDINFDEASISVTDKRHKKIVYYLNEKAFAVIKKWMLDREIKMNGIDNEALFISNQRKRISQKSVSRIVNKYSKEALGESLSPHKLRSAFCTILYNETGDIELVRDVVGHSNVSTTQRYIVKNKNLRKDASDMVANLVGI